VGEPQADRSIVSVVPQEFDPPLVKIKMVRVFGYQSASGEVRLREIEMPAGGACQ